MKANISAKRVKDHLTPSWFASSKVQQNKTNNQQQPMNTIIRMKKSVFGPTHPAIPVDQRSLLRVIF